MRTTLRQFVIALALAGTAGAALAAPAPDDYRRGHDRHHDSDWQRRQEREHRQRDREWQREQREELRRRAEWQRQRDHEWQRRQEAELRRRADRQRHYYSSHDRHDYHHDYRDDHRWQRGNRYHGHHYVVRDYGHYHLRRPPHGHHWVKVDNRYLLVAIATGLILDIASR